MKSECDADLRKAAVVPILTLGQYLKPGVTICRVKNITVPDEFTSLSR